MTIPLPMNRIELERLWRNPGNWHFYFIYFCPSDPRVVVPKRIRALGWTLNFARPAVPVIAFLLAAVAAISDLASALRAGRNVRADITVLLAFGFILLDDFDSEEFTEFWH